MMLYRVHKKMEKKKKENVEITCIEQACCYILLVYVMVGEGQGGLRKPLSFESSLTNLMA
jgi:hypothetical protein